MRKICRESDGIAQEVWEMLRQDEIDGAQAMRLAAALNKMPESETGRQIRDNGLCAIRRFFQEKSRQRWRTVAFRWGSKLVAFVGCLALVISSSVAVTPGDRENLLRWETERTPVYTKFKLWEEGRNPTHGTDINVVSEGIVIHADYIPEGYHKTVIGEEQPDCNWYVNADGKQLRIQAVLPYGIMGVDNEDGTLEELEINGDYAELFTKSDGEGGVRFRQMVWMNQTVSMPVIVCADVLSREEIIKIAENVTIEITGLRRDYEEEIEP